MNTELRGFDNLGNTCYMNSILQAILSVKYLNRQIILCIKKDPESIRSMNPLFIEYLKILLTLIDVEKNITLAPSMFKKVLGSKNRIFSGYAQQDAHEAMICIFSEFLDEKRDKTIYNVLSDCLYGKFCQTLECTDCGHVGRIITSFQDIEVPIPPSANPTLEKCIELFSEKELLKGDERWTCEKCKKKVEAFKMIKIQSSPKVLTITLNRFKGTVKNSTYVDIPLKLSIADKTYNLVSTVNHYGSVNGGHYTASVQRNGLWYTADDKRITNINPSNVSTQSVYITVYEMNN